MIDEIENLPEVSFIDYITLDDVQRQMVSDYQERYETLTGTPTTLGRADPPALVLYACSIQIYQALLYVDRAGKQDLLKYSYGEFMDNLAALKGIKREPAKAAVVKVKFTLSGLRPHPVAIPAGTRVTNGNRGRKHRTDLHLPDGRNVRKWTDGRRHQRACGPDRIHPERRERGRINRRN